MREKAWFLLMFAAGTLFISLGVAGSGDPFGRALAIGGGLVWYLVGLLVVQAWDYIPYCRQRPGAEWDQVTGGLIAIVIGLMIAFISFADPRDEAFHVERWVVTAAGLTFILAGIVMVRSSALAWEDRVRDPVVPFLVGFLLACFSATAFGIAFTGTDPGEISFAGMSTAAGDLPGKIIPGSAGLLLAWLCYRQFREGWRRLRAPKRTLKN